MFTPKDSFMPKYVEPEFRAWDGQEFLYFTMGSLVRAAEEPDQRFPSGHRVLDVLCAKKDQWVGLQDIKGVKIFSGDVVRVLLGDEVTEAPVIYDENEAGFFLHCHKGYHDRWGLTRKIIDACSYEVVGHIYSNAGLPK